MSMKAVHFFPPGGMETLKVSDDPIPEIDNDEVLIKVEATGVIWTELFWPIYQKEDGSYMTPIPGHDYAGTIAKVGASFPDKSITVGTHVMAFTSKRDNDGAMAGYAKAHADDIVVKPDNLTLDEAASVPLSALTAWQALFEKASLKRGDRLLVTGAAGPTALWAVQFGKNVGAEVIGTASSKASFDLLDSLNIDKKLNYKTDDIEASVKDVDVVFDTVGGDTARQCFRTLKKGGTLININDPTIGEIAKGSDSTALFFIVSMNKAQLTQINGLLEKGKVRSVVDKAFAFEDFAAAFAHGAQGHSNGRIVLKGPGRS